jgi:ariadne-1
LVYLDKGWCLILLRQFKWDKEYLREEYYNNNEQYLRKAGFKPNLGSPHHFNRGVVGTCEVCCSEEVTIYYNICGHNFCIECWVGHLKNCIQGGSAFPNCLDGECPHPVLIETIQGILRLYGDEGEQWLKKYEKKLCEMFITTNRNYQFCTGVDCGNCIKVNTPLDTVVCACGKVFCFRCQSDDHYPCKCD